MVEVEDIFIVGNIDVWLIIVIFIELYVVVVKFVCDVKVEEIGNDEIVVCLMNEEKFDINDENSEIIGVEKFVIIDENSIVVFIIFVVLVLFCSDVKSVEDILIGEVIFFVVSVILLVGVFVLKIVLFEDIVKLIIGVVIIELLVVWIIKLFVILIGVDVKLKIGDVIIELLELVMLKFLDIVCDVIIIEFLNDIVFGVEIWVVVIGWEEKDWVVELFVGLLDCIIVLIVFIMELVCIVVGVEVVFVKNLNVLEMVFKSMVEDFVVGVVNIFEFDDFEKKDFEIKLFDGERELLVVLVIDLVEVIELVDNVGDLFVEEFIIDVCDNNLLVKERLEVEFVLVVGVKLLFLVGKIVDEFLNKEINDELIVEFVDKFGVGLIFIFLLVLNILLILVFNGCEVVIVFRLLDILLLKLELIKFIRMVDDVCDGINDVKDEFVDEDKILELFWLGVIIFWNVVIDVVEIIEFGLIFVLLSDFMYELGIKVEVVEFWDVVGFNEDIFRFVVKDNVVIIEVVVNDVEINIDVVVNDGDVVVKNVEFKDVVIDGDVVKDVKFKIKVVVMDGDDNIGIVVKDSDDNIEVVVKEFEDIVMDFIVMFIDGVIIEDIVEFVEYVDWCIDGINEDIEDDFEDVFNVEEDKNFEFIKEIGDNVIDVEVVMVVFGMFEDVIVFVEVVFCNGSIVEDIIEDGEGRGVCKMELVIFNFVVEIIIVGFEVGGIFE